METGNLHGPRDGRISAVDAVLKSYRAAWLVQFEVHRLPGEPPRPKGMSAMEVKAGRRVQLHGKDLAGEVPFGVDETTLVVVYDAGTAMGCHLALGWPLPSRLVDLHAEFRCHTSGLLPPGDYGLEEALAYFGLQGAGVEGLEQLLTALLPTLDLPRAIAVRGRYTKAVARMERLGVPVDTETFHRLQVGWDGVRDQLIRVIDGRYNCFLGGEFVPARWRLWLNRHRIPWPRVAPTKLDLHLDTFRDMAQAYPEVGPMKELLCSLAQLRGFRLGVGADGRNRCSLRPFASKTGRNQPRTTEFVFGPATWVRSLIRPSEGRAVAYIDYSSQEFGTAAALSQDPAMMAAYKSGDPYLAFARQAGAVSAEATKATHAEVREQFKACCLGVQYGMGACSLGIRLGVTVGEADELLGVHRRTYPGYWAWSDGVVREARAEGRLRAALGWTVHVGPELKPRSLRNFPLQANGAEMLRLACMALTEKGVAVCCPVHDALLVEAAAESVDDVVAECQRVMASASAAVLGGFPLRSEAKVFRHPERYMDPRGERMWRGVLALLERVELRKCG